MTALIRSAGIAGFDGLAAELGLDAGQQLRRVGLSLAALRDPETLIPYNAVLQLFERAARDSGCSDFGMRLAQRQGLGILGPVAVLMKHGPTVGEAFGMASRYIFVHSPAIRFWVERVPTNAAQTDLCFGIDMPHAPPCTQTIELALGVILRVFAVLNPAHTRPLCVLMPHAALSEPAAYLRHYGCTTVFGQHHAAVRVPSESLQQALPENDPALRRLAQDYLDSHFVRPDQAFADKVRSLLRRQLSMGLAEQTQIAEMLAVHTRTLHRRLADEGSGFAQIKDEVRREVFEQLAARQPGLPLSQIAAMLDYDNQSALTRSCRRWFGVAPREFLAARRG